LNSSELTQGQLSYGMQRFLTDLQDEHMMHENITSQMSTRSRGIQTVIDRVDELGLAGKIAERKQKK
jgi:hypothetical protein